MKKFAALFVFALSIACSQVKVVHDEFDNSSVVSLDVKEFYDDRGMSPVDGQLEVARILFQKDSASKPLSDISLFCKFVGSHGEIFEGDSLELNIDGSIYSLEPKETRAGAAEIETGSSRTVFTRLGAFTFSDAKKANIHVIALDLTLSKEIQEALLASEKIMIRILTKNIDGLLKNTFKFKKKSVSDIKNFIMFESDK